MSDVLTDAFTAGWLSGLAFIGGSVLLVGEKQKGPESKTSAVVGAALVLMPIAVALKQYSYDYFYGVYMPGAVLVGGTLMFGSLLMAGWKTLPSAYQTAENIAAAAVVTAIPLMWTGLPVAAMLAIRHFTGR